MKKKVAVLGATGSIGKSTLDILRNEKDHFDPVLFTANSKAEELEKLKSEFPSVKIALGKDEILNAIASVEMDIAVNGISGAAGLEPSAAVLSANSDLALANKETIVMAGHIVMALAREKKVNIIPVDSEHSALFKLIEAHGRDNTSEVILTASGGPFRDYSKEKLASVTPEEALTHPTWKMGPKITVDSATLANKGLEVIEAARLFGFPAEKIKVVIHPQSIVHSMIRLKNGAVYAQLSKPDMRLPIHDSLTWPETEASPYGALDFDSLFLNFEKADLARFPMLALAYEALKAPPLPVVYNAANEVAVEAFLKGKIGFLEIPRIVKYVLSMKAEKEIEDIDKVLTLDRESRKLAAGFIDKGIS
ncbi:MAG: 1-deoxy-D-xylulose-5-phosphate reductoisomerase [Treponema sp.]|jgi:1-deoxy-D-xylulose-5-phosphate reductoisomerase|nr:1-deoxy-D-xylulose-5-phosphate reductoisomerase [Treponema sp.]